MNKILLLAPSLMSLQGCASFAFISQHTPIGTIYADVSYANEPTDNDVGRKKGEACAISILGLVTTGDAGIKTAAEAAGITQIASVDATYTNVLGIYSKYCTVVSGDAGAGERGGE
jgi:hypothetical protein